MAPVFVADEMLGDIAKWLRIMGYDVKYRRGRSDHSLIEIARGGAILLTSDKDLHSRATRKGLVSVLVTGETIVDKLVTILGRFGLRPDLDNTRCTVCGGTLRLTENDKTGRTTWSCESCGKVYWKGSHWRNIAKTIESVERGLARPGKQINMTRR